MNRANRDEVLKEGYGALTAVSVGSGGSGQMQAYFAAGFERGQVPQAVIDASATYVLVNDAFCSLVERSRDELLSLTPMDLTHPADDGGATASLLKVLAGELADSQVERMVATPDGEPIPILVSQSAVLDDDGNVTGAYAMFQDLRILRDSESRLEQQRQFYTALGEHSHDAALVVDADGRMLYASPAVTGLFGYTPDQLLSQPGWDFMHPDDVDRVREVFATVVKEGGTQSVTFRVRCADGSWRWVEETQANLLASPIHGIVCNLVDVTERREAERRLELIEARNQAIVETAQEGVWLIRNTQETEYANAQMAQILGLPLELLYTGGFRAVLDRTDNDGLAARLRDRHLLGPEKYEIAYQHPDGAERILLVSSAPLTYGDGDFVGTLASVSDVTEARRAEQELRRAALHDPLTGLPNHTLLVDRLDQAILRGRAAADDAAVAVLVLDLDQFKLVNDTRGHDVGDDVLVEAARRLLAHASARDTVARLGGDTFVVVADVDSDRSPELVAEALRAALSEPYVLDGHTVHLTVTIGIASNPPYDAADVLRFAESAMYAAKAAGRAQVRRFDESLAHEAERAYALTGDLRAALRDDTVQMHYQPIVSLTTGAVVGYEALARWSRDGVDVSPSVFVPLAERTGAARELDQWAVRRGITEFARLRTAADVPHDAYVSINLSAQHLSDPALVRLLVQTAADAEFPPHQVSLEITEGAVVGDATEAVGTLRELHRRGFKVSIDDFGTGYSSMAYLRNFPVTSLKIDRLFVADLGEDDDAGAIVTSIVQLARAIGIETIAEGVETTEQAVQLRLLGCTAAQGWLWSPALAAAQLAVTNRHYPVPAPGGASPSRRVRAGGPASAIADVREEHGLVRLLELQRQGASLTTIAAALNAEGFRAPNGQRWHKMTVARALSYLAPDAPPQERDR